MSSKVDALLVMSFGGPEGPEDVMPFLDNVLRGKNVPEERKREVAHHYDAFGGVSPLNDHNRELISLLRADFDQSGVALPIYWGNRNWYPYVRDTLAQMHEDGVRRALMYVTSGYSCYSGCRQYREDIQRSLEQLGIQDSLTVDKIRVFYNHPGFIEVNSAHIREAISALPAAVRNQPRILFTAHSIPMSMANSSRYVQQLEEACRLVGESLGTTHWKLVYQSRSGPPSMPWLEPDICDELEAVHQAGDAAVIISPIGFTSDHMEVLYDLDVEAKEKCDALGLPMQRAKAAGNHPRMIRMIRELVMERMDPSLPKAALGNHGPSHDVCPAGCCPAPQRPPVGAAGR